MLGMLLPHQICSFLAFLFLLRLLSWGIKIYKPFDRLPYLILPARFKDSTKPFCLFNWLAGILKTNSLNITKSPLIKDKNSNRFLSKATRVLISWLLKILKSAGVHSQFEVWPFFFQREYFPDGGFSCLRGLCLRSSQHKQRGNQCGSAGWWNRWTLRVPCAASNWYVLPGWDLCDSAEVCRIKLRLNLWSGLEVSVLCGHHCIFLMCFQNTSGLVQVNLCS